MTQNDNDDELKEICLRRLESWRVELKTNAHGMKKYAARAIKMLEDDISRRWPGAL